MASSEIDATIGMIMTPTPTPAAIIVCWGDSDQMFWMMFGAMKVRAKKPITTLGMPARISMIGLSTRRTFGLAYSLR